MEKERLKCISTKLSLFFLLVMGATDGISQGILDLRLICEDIPEVIESYVRIRLVSVGLRYFQEDLLVAWCDLA